MGFISFLRGHEGERADDDRHPTTPTVRIRFRFVGSVQAVGFRWTTTNLAKSVGATGWVKNERDGSVTAEIQGAPDQVESVVDGLDEYYNGSSWSGGFQIAAREYIPLVKDESVFRVSFA